MYSHRGSAGSAQHQVLLLLLLLGSLFHNSEGSVNTNPQQCKVLMFVSDQDSPKNNLMSGSEFVFFLQRMAQGSVPFPENTPFEELPQSLQTIYTTYATSNGEIDINGAQPGSTPTSPEQGAGLDQLCSAAVTELTALLATTAPAIVTTTDAPVLQTGTVNPAATGVPETPGLGTNAPILGNSSSVVPLPVLTPTMSPGTTLATTLQPSMAPVMPTPKPTLLQTDCVSFMGSVDTDVNLLIDQNEFVGFLSQLSLTVSGNAVDIYAGKPYDTLSVNMQSIFQTYALATGPSISYATTGQDAILSNFCIQSTSAVQDEVQELTNGGSGTGSSEGNSSSNIFDHNNNNNAGNDVEFAVPTTDKPIYLPTDETSPLLTIRSAFQVALPLTQTEGNMTITQPPINEETLPVEIWNEILIAYEMFVQAAVPPMLEILNSGAAPATTVAPTTTATTTTIPGTVLADATVDPLVAATMQPTSAMGINGTAAPGLGSEIQQQQQQTLNSLSRRRAQLNATLGGPTATAEPSVINTNTTSNSSMPGITTANGITIAPTAATVALSALVNDSIRLLAMESADCPAIVGNASTAPSTMSCLVIYGAYDILVADDASKESLNNTLVISTQGAIANGDLQTAISDDVVGVFIVVGPSTPVDPAPVIPVTSAPAALNDGEDDGEGGSSSMIVGIAIGVSAIVICCCGGFFAYKKGMLDQYLGGDGDADEEDENARKERRQKLKDRLNEKAKADDQDDQDQFGDEDDEDEESAR